MTAEQVIKVIETEKTCVQRAIKGCNRDCRHCDLVMPDKDVIEGYNMAISALEKQIPQEPIKLKSNEDIEIGAGTWKAGTTVYKCPCCDSFISRSSNYCPHCGCRMDLEDEEQK